MTLDRAVSIREAYLQASSFLSGHGIEEHRLIAERLICHVLDWSRTQLFLRWDEPFPPERAEQWRRLLDRKAAGEPLQYLLGEQEFYGLPFRVTPAVLIPRPETELLVEHAIRRGRERWAASRAGEDGAGRLDSPFVVDIGTGSGAIPVTIAAQCPEWRVMASDISAAALSVARENAQLNGVAHRIAFREGDLLKPFIQEGARIDILLSNPPYIPSETIKTLMPEVRLYEPRTALDGGDDGLTPYRRLVAQMAELPQYPAIVGFEVGQGQAGDVAAMLAECGQWDLIEIVPDLAGIERHVFAIQDKGRRHPE